MTSPASGFAPNQVKNSNRSSSDHNLSASAAKVGVSIKKFTIANYTSRTYYIQDLKINAAAQPTPKAVGWSGLLYRSVQIPEVLFDIDLCGPNQIFNDGSFSRASTSTFTVMQWIEDVPTPFPIFGHVYAVLA